MFLQNKGFLFQETKRERKRIKENKKTKPFRTLVVARLPPSLLGSSVVPSPSVLE